MLEKVDILTVHNTTLELPLQNVSSGIIVKDIQGLDPVKSTISTAPYAQRDGSQYQGSRRESRNIVFRLGLDSRYGGGTITDIRRHLSRFMMPNSEIKMSFHMASGLVLEISGRVEDAQVSIFSAEPEMMVSVMCFDPDFIDPVLVEESGEAYPTRSEREVIYAGTIPTGIDLELWVNNSDQDTNNFIVYHRAPNNVTRQLRFNANLKGGDRILVTTHPGSKNAIRRRSGVETAILYGVTPTSIWTSFVPGRNTISITGTNQQSYYEFKYFNRYGSL